jgi:alpha-galactosidase/6-phospho-beta-glucosidase family protein
VIEAAIAIRVPQRLDVLPLPAVPELPRALLSQQAAFETLTTRALLGAATEEGLTRALLANPMVRSVDQARGLVDAIRRSVEAGPG